MVSSASEPAFVVDVMEGEKDAMEVVVGGPVKDMVAGLCATCWLISKGWGGS